MLSGPALRLTGDQEGGSESRLGPGHSRSPWEEVGGSLILSPADPILSSTDPHSTPELQTQGEKAVQATIPPVMARSHPERSPSHLLDVFVGGRPSSPQSGSNKPLLALYWPFP